jgi:hypothetical protein
MCPTTVTTFSFFCAAAEPFFAFFFAYLLNVPPLPLPPAAG